MRTWQAEILVVAVVLSIVTVATGATLVSVMSEIAVLASFGHAQVSERMREQEAARPTPSVECYRKLTLYWVAKEIGWASVFVATGAWPALVGCVVFLAYPWWRRWWRARHPINNTETA